jgi:multidrug efflux pump subunit AcrA (membrane-fusion protein)
MMPAAPASKRPRRALWIAISLLAVLAAAVASARWARPADDGVPTLKLQRTDFDQRVPAPGNLEAVEATPVTVPVDVPGPFRIGWLAPDGSRVKQGEVVIRFDSSEIEKTLIDAQDDLREARLRLGKQEVESRAKIEKLAGDLALAQIELENARQFQKKDSLIFSHHDIIESDIDQQLAQERSEHASRSRGGEERLARTEDALQQIKIRQAEAKIDRARRGLKALTVTAPHDGVLILKRNWRGEATRIGDSVWNGQPLAEIPELSAMQAEVFVLEADAGGLKAGKPATVVVESAPGRSFGAKIARVDALAKPRIPGSPVQYFGVTLALDRTDPTLMKPGQRVQSTLFLETRKGVLMVPRQALFDVDGKSVVYRRKGRSFEAVTVTLGPARPGQVVVESGLRDGDEIALIDPDRAGKDRSGKPGEETPAPGGAPAAAGPAR